MTEGHDGLRDRLFDHPIRGARFAKWRAIFSIDGVRPSHACISVNASALGRFAALCQEIGLVPIIEPEVPMGGGHGIARCADVTEMVLHRVIVEMAEQGVRLEALLLKPNMIVPGLSSTEACTSEDVAAETLTCLLCSVPAAVAGIVFLSGGQAAVQATQRLHAIVRKAGANAPWPIGFSFVRAIQQPALQIWGGRPDCVGSAQASLEHRASSNRAARLGTYDVCIDALGENLRHLPGDAAALVS